MGAYNPRFIHRAYYETGTSTNNPSDPIGYESGISLEGIFVQGEAVVAGDNLDGLYCKSVEEFIVSQPITGYPNGLMAGGEYVYLSDGSIVEITEQATVDPYAIYVGAEALLATNGETITLVDLGGIMVGSETLLTLAGETIVLSEQVMVGVEPLYSNNGNLITLGG